VSENEIDYEDVILDECGLTLLAFADKKKPQVAADAFVSVHENLLATYRAIKDTKDDAPKVDAKYKETWKADESAKNIAAEIVSDIVADIDYRMAQESWSPSLVYHFREQVREILGKFATTEVDYQEYLAEQANPQDKAPTDPKAELANRYKAGKEMATNLIRMIESWAPVPAEYFDSSGKQTNTTLPALPGNYGGGSNGSAGRNAVTYTLAYRIDDVDYREPKSALRAIFTGADRAGRTTTDLADLLKSEVGDDLYAFKGERSFEYKGHTVTVWRQAK
jgi:hypothetical protein